MKNRITPENITSLNKDEVFVFGSNLAGRHGAGAAKLALSFGGVYGIGEGISGFTYAIPTKDYNIDTLDLDSIQRSVNRFIQTAQVYKSKTFLVTKIGCGLAGYTVEDIAPLFKKAMSVENIYLPEEFWTVLLYGKGN